MNNLFLTMLVTGLFGGTVNFFHLYSDENKGWINYFRCVIAGLGASFLVPLFLQMISSNLIENSKANDKDLLVFVGFCLIAAIFSRRFIETIGEKVLRQVKEAKETAETAKEIAQSNKEEVELLTTKSTEVDTMEQIPANSVTESTEKTSTSKVSPVIAKNVINVLKALRDNLYTFRTLDGISKDTNLSKEYTMRVLNAFKEKDWVKEIEKDGKTLYALTEAGHKIKVINED